MVFDVDCFVINGRLKLGFNLIKSKQNLKK